MRPWMTGLIAVVLMFSASTDVSAQVQFRWKLATGQAFDVELTQRVETDTQLGTMPVRVIADSTLVQQWTVTEVDAMGMAMIEQQFKRIAVKLELPQGGAIAYDSESTKKPTAEAQNIAASLSPLVGAKLNVKLAANGEISDVQLSAELADQLAKMPGNSSWKSLFSRDGLRQWMRQALVVFPDEPVATDGTWQREMEIAAPVGKIRQTSKYRYAGAEPKDGAMLDRIEVTSRVEIARGDAAVDPPAIKQQSNTGQIWFDSAAGRLVESRSTQQLRTEAKVRDTVVGVTVNSQLKTRLTPR